MRGGIIYISSNREKPEFENKIIKDMDSKRGDLRIYAVLQRFPEDINVSGNISFKTVGDVGTSGFNFCRQLQLATEMAYKDECDYVVSCEADCLYSPDYFTFAPTKLDRVYRNTNNYVLPYKQEHWYEKDSQTAFQVSGTKFLLDRLNYLLKDQSMWDTKMKNFPKEIGKPFLEDWDIFKTKYPCFGIKTSDGMRKQTRHGKEEFKELPYWGTAKSIRQKYL